MEPRGNSVGLLIGAVLAVGAMVVAAQSDRDGSQGLLSRAPFVGYAFVPISIAIAELRSGYAWKNLAPGNRGVARVCGPRAFFFSVAGHTAFACGLLAFGLLSTPPKPAAPNPTRETNADSASPGGQRSTARPDHGTQTPNNHE